MYYTLRSVQGNTRKYTSRSGSGLQPYCSCCIEIVTKKKVLINLVLMPIIGSNTRCKVAKIIMFQEPGKTP